MVHCIEFVVADTSECLRNLDHEDAVRGQQHFDTRHEIMQIINVVEGISRNNDLSLAVSLQDRLSGIFREVLVEDLQSFGSSKANDVRCRIHTERFETFIVARTE